MQKIVHDIYSFDGFRLDLTRGALFRGDAELKLRPKSYDVLRYLAENQGRLVTKDELIGSVWNETAVTDDSLVQCLKDIRRVLGDDEQLIIRTVPRRGYIFEKEVVTGGAATYTRETSGVHLVIEETRGSFPVLERGFRYFKRTLGTHKRTAFAALGLAAVVAGSLLYRPVASWVFRPPSIAILPIINTTGDVEIDYVSDGLTESIITSLAQLNESGKDPRLRLIAQNTVFMFKNKEFEPRSVGRELGVDSVLAGQMFRQGQMRIFKFELIDVDHGSIIWRKQYSSAADGVLLGLQDEIPRDIVQQLPISLSAADRENLTRRYTQNAEAWELYLKGRAEFRKVTPSGLSKSIEYYQQAIHLDPQFALAFWAMGSSYISLGNIDEQPDKEASEKAMDLFQRALQIDNNLDLAARALKLNEANAWDWKAIEKAGPSHPGYDRFLGAMGRLEEKLESEKRRLANNPYAPFLNFTHCNTLLALRRTDEAIAQCRKTLNIVPTADKAYFGPESPWIHLYLSLAYSQKEMYAEAEDELKLAVGLGENSKTLLAELAAVYANSGQRDKAIEILEQLLERQRRGEYAPSLNISHIYIALGNKEQAFVWLNRAIDEREDRVVSLKFSDIYDPLRGDPRFTELLRRLDPLL